MKINDNANKRKEKALAKARGLRVTLWLSWGWIETREEGFELLADIA